MASKSTSSYKSSGKSPGKVSNGTSEKSREEEINSIPLVDDDLTDDDWDERDLNPTLVPDVNAHQSTQSTVKTLSGPSVAFLNGLESPSTGPECMYQLVIMSSEVVASSQSNETLNYPDPLS